MKSLGKFITAGCLLFLFHSLAFGQDSSGFDPHKVFDPHFMNDPVSAYRSSDGAPGPQYWQNRSDYNLSVKLDPDQNIISGTDEITYTNNSLDALPYVWLQLGQNRFKENSRGNLVYSPVNAGKGASDGFDIQSVQITIHGKTMDADYIISDTRMQIRLPEALKADGDQLKITIEYKLKFNPGHTARSGMGNYPNGAKLVEAAQWYPRMSVYDDVNGWNTLPFLGPGEFYCDYGTINYSVNVPWNYIVMGSGVLQNPDQVLTGEQQARLDRVRKSKDTVFIIKPDEAGNSKEIRPANSGRLTWKFKMEQTRDVAWAASPAFIWDAAKANLPDGSTTLVMSAYPPSSAGQEAWGRSTEYLKRSIELFSEHWFPYPYKSAVNLGGFVGGMEYPGIIFCSMKVKNGTLWMLTAHEIGHDWFPMIVGSSERRHAWMDEGFNTFIDIYATEKFNNGEYAPKRDGEYAPKGGNPPREIVPFLKSKHSIPIDTRPDVMNTKYLHTLEYYKTALGLVILREQVLGSDRFDYAFRTCTREWAFKHPTPKDFFRTMNNAAGEDLNWFWKEWFYKTWTLDQAVTNVQYVDQDPSKGALITITNNDQMVMPLQVGVYESNGEQATKKFPVEIWQNGGSYTFKYGSSNKLDSVVVDPGRNFPDVHASNNKWVPKY